MNATKTSTNSPMNSLFNPIIRLRFVFAEIASEERLCRLCTDGQPFGPTFGKSAPIGVSSGVSQSRIGLFWMIANTEASEEALSQGSNLFSLCVYDIQCKQFLQIARICGKQSNVVLLSQNLYQTFDSEFGFNLYSKCLLCFRLFFIENNIIFQMFIILQNRDVSRSQSETRLAIKSS